ncbi:MAG: hypothetical protein K1W38_11550 [Lachnospiraceae bacterium]
MKEKHTDSVQNRFTAYLVAAVGNTRKKYWERKYRLQGMDLAQEDLLERNYTDFDEQYRAYINEYTDFIFRDWQRYEELLARLESDHLAKAISRLKGRDREILFARVMGSLLLRNWESGSIWRQNRLRWHITMYSGNCGRR